MNFELTPIDRHFARFISREAGGGSPLLELVASLVSNTVGSGHICLDLAEIAGSGMVVDGRERALPPLEGLRDSLAEMPVVGAPGDFRPLVLDRAGRLYLHRYWRYERELIDVIKEMTSAASPGIDRALLKDGVERLFPEGEGGIDWQKVAAVAAVMRRFLVISGGPGTGKTSTVVKIIALLLEQDRVEPLRIALAAPTGKAAARLSDSIRAMKDKLDCSREVKGLVPEGVTTIHRLLGPMGGTARFRFSRDNPLPYDVVIIDEGSMIPLPLMSRLASAMRGEGRLIILGDRDQLASVEAGAVLADICGDVGEVPFSTPFSVFIAETTGARITAVNPGGPLPPLADSLVALKRNYRFSAESGIGRAATAVRDGDGVSALSIIGDGAYPEMKWRQAPSPDGLKKELARTVVEGYVRFLQLPSPTEALASFDAFRILCAVRQGPYGVLAVNSLVEGTLAEKGLIDPASRWYHGRPVMVTVNDYNLRLFNGDVGIAFADPESGGKLRVFFPAPGGVTRKFSPSRLPAHETVYAMTVHKSQGSEFDRILFILPPTDSEILTRELIYTAITRAKSGVEIWGEEKVFIAGVERRIERKSGLKDALWPQGG